MLLGGRRAAEGALTQQHITDEHHAKAHQEGVGDAAGAVFLMGHGDHFVADHIEHGAAGEGQGEGENGSGDRNGKET